MTQKAQPSFVITANRLSDGAVLYLDAASAWVSDLGHAHETSDPGERDRLLAFAKSCELTICGPYALEIARAPDGGRLLSARERLRALGAADVRRRLGY
jgi:hypothetical protein